MTPALRCDLCRPAAARLTGDLCKACAAALAPQYESFAAELSGRLDLTRPVDRETWATLLDLLAEVLLLRGLLPNAAAVLRRQRGAGPVRGPAAGKPRPKGRR